MSLRDWLEHADSVAASTREQWDGQIPSAQDLPAVAEVGAQVDRLIDDLFEATKQIAVAGLAYPDPELPDELIGLAQRCRRHGLPTAVGLLLRLRSYLLALSETAEVVDRSRLSTQAFEETQRLLTWLRLFRVEHDLLMVQAKLAAGAVEEGITEVQRPETATTSLSAWPLGLELARNGRLRIHACELDEHTPVELHDDVQDLDVRSPMRGRTISRLFQDGVQLEQVMASVIRLDEHPVVTLEDGTLLFRPAFQARPALRPVTDSFEAPSVPTVPLDVNQAPNLDGLPDRPHLLAGRVARRKQVTRVLTAGGGPGRVPLSRLLRFNLAKLLIREASAEVEARFTVVPRGGHPVPVAVETDFDGRVFPHLDPTVFRLAKSVLAKRADQDPNPPGTLAGGWLRTAAYLLGGGDRHQIPVLKAHLADLEGAGLMEDYRIGLARFYAGVEPSSSDDLLARVEAALSLGVADESAVNVGQLADVLGRDQASPADLREVDGALLYAAVWLALAAEWTDDLGPALATLYTERYGGQLDDPTVGDICCRALLMGIIGIGDELAEVDGEVEALEDEPEDMLRTPEGLQFLLAHVASFQAGRGRSSRPLPTLLEVLQLGDTLTLLTGGDRLGVPVIHLNLPTERLRTAVLDALFDWTFSPDDDPQTRLAAGDALAVLAGSQLGPLFLA